MLSAKTGINVRGFHAVTGRKTRLRRDVYDALTRERGANTVEAQARLLGIKTRTLWRIRAGGTPSLPNAVRIAEQLGVPLAVVFETLEDEGAAS
jgi:hypothetical protein